MQKTKIKFFLSVIFLIVSIVISLFFSENIDLLVKILAPIFFVYFLIDITTVLLPSCNNQVYSGKHLNKFYIETKYFSEVLLSKKIHQQNKRSLLIFLLYFSILTAIGVFIINVNSIRNEYIYIIFLLINLGDYFCILVWCPFRSLVLKNICCNNCRISNWDRLMKFYILIFIPSFYSITLVLLGLIIFFVWEYKHYIHPERFYLVSNKSLTCNTCQYHMGCKKNKE